MHEIEQFGFRSILLAAIEIFSIKINLFALQNGFKMKLSHIIYLSDS
jgi:hypothetical protein